MEYHVKKLQLFQNLSYSKTSTFMEEKMIKYTTLVDKKNLEPKPEDYLVNPHLCGNIIKNEDPLPQDTECIPAGLYAFVQSDYTEGDLTQAAEALWLECLWEEYEPLDDTIYLRELEHGDRTVFQLFRKIKG